MDALLLEVSSKSWVRDYDGTSRMSELTHVHHTLQGWAHGPISQMRKLKQVCACTKRLRREWAAFHPWPCCQYGSFYCCPWLLSFASSPNPKPWSSHSDPFHLGFVSSASQEDAHGCRLADPALFPHGSDFCHLWDTGAPPSSLQLSAVAATKLLTPQLA